MRKLTTIVFVGLTVLGGSCKKYLDINTNPNQATSATPQLILPQALTATANVLNTFNTYGMEVGGYGANAGGYGGFGTAISYNFSSNDWGGLWSSTYDNLEDYQAIINYTSTQLPNYAYFNAAARIMKAYDFELLVDAYNNIPYSTALKGSDALTPTYDDAATIYASLAAQLDSAIATINTGLATPGIAAMGSSDVLFAGSATKWKQLANTLKLRLIVRASGKSTFANKTFDAVGFLSSDALINPGFTRDNGKQNPAWNNWAFSYTGGDATKSWVPSKFAVALYDGHKLTDSARGNAVYYQFSIGTGTNQLGYENVNVPKCPSGSFWYSGSNRSGSSAGTTIGTLKGPDAGYPVMIAAESYFLQAEAVVRGLITSSSTDASLFNSGISASFNYLYQLPNKSIAAGVSPVDSVNKYLATNSSSYLVNYSMATTTAMKTEAIITQKYIALNFVNSQEGWNEYRRTHYPTLVNGGTAYQTFASSVSESTRPDKLPTRILYPTSEGSYNPGNVPTNITPFTSLIFWAL